MKKICRTVFVLLGFLTAVSGCGKQTSFEYRYAEEMPADREESAESAETEETEIPEEDRCVVVFVSGAVGSPGVYELPEGARVFEAVEMAGGFLPEAQTDAVNLAAFVQDGSQIRIPKEGEPVPETGQDPGGQEKVNLNTADRTALMTLHGIGEAKAEAIIAYRNEHGAFGSIEEILRVNGIKESTFQSIKNDITV